jgi:methionyl-tRNA synthetase
VNGKQFFITTAIDYANGDPHLGHALEKVGADAIARFHRLIGRDVHFLIGMDEHGQKVARSAADAGRSPQEYVDAIVERFERAWAALGISNDEFVRTTAPQHKTAVQELITMIFERNPDDFYEKSYRGRYCVGCESFKADADIVDGKCVLHPTRTIEIIEERNWFFRLSKYGSALRAHYDAHPQFIQPEFRKNEMLSLLDSGLEDISASRARITWGVPFPRPLSTGETQTTYVWFDALPNYWTVTRKPDARVKWPAQVHVVGKDITRFHTVIWPAMLMAAGQALPEKVWVHGFISLGGERFSKSAGVLLDLDETISRFGPDAFRYYLLRDVPFDGDGGFSWERFAEVYESELANTLGNLASRATAMVEKYFGGEVPHSPPGDHDRAVGAALTRSIGLVTGTAGFPLQDTIAGIMQTVRETNEFVQRATPWSLARDPARREELAAVLATTVRCLAGQAISLSPIMPGKSQELWRSLGGPGNVHAQRWNLDGLIDVSAWRVAKGSPLFPKPDQTTTTPTS